jgi:hypothetical protein
MVELRLAFPQGGQDVISIPDLVAMRELTEALQDLPPTTIADPASISRAGTCQYR